jgi:hypothetical protein
MCTEDVKELLDRTRRLESRLVQLGDFVGANLRAKQKIEVVIMGARTGVPYVRIDALDVSVSRIATELKQHNVRHGKVPVFLGDEIVFTLNLDNLQ